MCASTIRPCFRRAFFFELVPRTLVRACILTTDCWPFALWPVVDKTILPVIAFLAHFFYRLISQCPKRHVSIGAVDGVKPDGKGFG